MTIRMTALGALLVLTGTVSVRAHHSESMFELIPVWVKGSVVEFSRTNPHSIVVLEATATDGQARRWAVEGLDPRRLDARGIGQDFLEIGDTIEFCAFPIRDQFASQDPAAPGFFHGQVLIMPDGDMQIWGNYGKLRNCVRPDDRIQTWVDFLNSDDRAWGAWCRRFRDRSVREDSRALADDIDGAMANRCE